MLTQLTVLFVVMMIYDLQGFIGLPGVAGPLGLQGEKVSNKYKYIYILNHKVCAGGDVVFNNTDFTH